MPTPEELARQNIDKQLEACGWILQSRRDLNLYAARDKVNLDIFWLSDESMEDSANPPQPDVLAAEIAEDLRTALTQFESIADNLNRNQGSEGGESSGNTIRSVQPARLPCELSDPQGPPEKHRDPGELLGPCTAKLSCGIIAFNLIAFIGTLIQRGGGTGPVMPRQPGLVRSLTSSLIA